MNLKSNTIIQPIAKINYTKCTKCEEYFDSGFFLDGEFYCKDCTLKDFQEYLNMRKECDN